MFTALKRVLRGGRDPEGAAGERAGTWLVLLAGLTLPCSACVQLGTAGESGGQGEGSEQGNEPNRPASSNVLPGGRSSGGSGGAASTAPMFGPASLRNVQLQGGVQYSFDDASFLYCGLQELWSVRFEGLAFESFQEVALGEECDIAGCLFLLAGTGDLSARGRFGSVREYPRELTVTSVINLERVTRVADLPSLNSVGCPR